MKKIEGLWTALVTPFDKRGALNLTLFSELVAWQIEEGVDGLVVLGITGEAPVLTSAESKKLIETCLGVAKGRVPVAVGTGASSTAETIARTKEAKAMGADCALVISPAYSKPTQEGLFRHFSLLLEECDLPVIVYNAPGRTGRNIEPATLKRLAKLPGMLAVKECSGLFDQTLQILATPGLTLVSGDDSWTLALMALGATGLISVASNLLPKVMKQFVCLLQEGKFTEAREEHHRLLPFFEACFIETNPSPIKAALSAFGWDVGDVRLPLCPLEAKNHRALLQLLEEHRQWQSSLSAS